MSTVKMAYGAVTPITLTLNGLAAAAARQGLAIDNTSAVYLDAMVTMLLSVVAGSPSDLSKINFYAYGSIDGTNFTDNASGLDAAMTMRSPANIMLLGSLNVPAGGVIYPVNFGSIAAAFMGVLPPKWGVVVENRCGLALAGSGNSANYRGAHAINV